MANSQDSPSVRENQCNHIFGVLVASGSATTSGTTNTANLVTHGAKDKDGNNFPAANLRVLAIPTMSTGTTYRSAATTATQIDIRAVVVSVTYDWFVFCVN